MRSLAARPALCTWLLVALFAGLVFYRLDGSPLWYADEAKNAERAREVLLTGDLGVVQANFEPSFNKPPLHYWLTAGALRAFGEGRFAIRFWNACFAVGTLVLTGRLARALAPELPWLPALSVLFLGLHGPFLQYARVGLLDLGLAFWTVGTLIASERAWRGPPRWWWLVAGVCAGLGGLYKVPLPLTFWLVWLGVRSWRDGGGRRTPWRCRELWLGLAVAVTLSLAWPAFQFARFGSAWWKIYGEEESNAMMDRRMTGVTFGPATYPMWLLMKWGLFALPALVGTGWVIWRGRKADGTLAGRFYEVAVLAAAYLAVLGCLWSKSHRYALLVQPLLAVTGGAFFLTWGRRLSPAWRTALVAVAALGITPVAWSDYTLRAKRDLMPQTPALARFGASARPQETLLVVNRVRSKYLVLFFGKLRQPVRDVKLGKVREIPGPLRGLVASEDWAALQQEVPGVVKVSEEQGAVEFARP